MTHLRIDPAGVLHAVYDEELNYWAFGRVRITRASHVETDVHSCWWADLSPVGGPRLGPFAFRSTALWAERHWLDTEWLDKPATPQ